MATKKCPFCAEEIQEEAIKCKHCGEMLDHQITASPSPSPEPSSVEEASREEAKPEKQKTNPVAMGCAILLVLMVGFWLYVAVRTPLSPPTPATRQSTGATTGDDVILKWSDSDSSGYLAVDDAAWDAMFEAINANDEIGVMQLVGAGRVYVVQSGTSARVLDTGFTSYKVRLMDGPSAGVAGWVVREFVQR